MWLQCGEHSTDATQMWLLWEEHGDGRNTDVAAVSRRRNGRITVPATMRKQLRTLEKDTALMWILWKDTVTAATRCVATVRKTQ
jgi:hypothetical protein